MSRKERIKLISKIESQLDCRVICYLTSTRRRLGYSINDECLPIFHNHLTSMRKRDKKSKVALLISSFGGSASVPILLNRLIRNYYENFYAIVPHLARSAATLIVLGAEKIYMHPMGTLGPIDPQVANEFSPQEESGEIIFVSIEDVKAYKRFLKEEWELTDSSDFKKALPTLTDEIHPILIGHIKRAIDRSSVDAQKLLEMVMGTKQKARIDKIVKGLTTETEYHGQPISPVDAKDLDIQIQQPLDNKLEESIWHLFSLYAEEMKLFEPFDPVAELNNVGKKSLILEGEKQAYIESRELTNVYKLKLKLVRPKPNKYTSPILREVLSHGAVALPMKSGWEVENSKP